MGRDVGVYSHEHGICLAGAKRLIAIGVGVAMCVVIGPRCWDEPDSPARLQGPERHFEILCQPEAWVEAAQ